MKKLFAMFMAMAMMVTMSVTTFAAGTGSITINGVSPGNTYEVYRLLDLESYDEAAGAYSYEANSDWETFFGTADAKKYFTTAADGYVTWTWTAPAPDPEKPDEPIPTEEEAIADFAKLALAYAKTNTIAPVKSSKTADAFDIDGTSGKFSDLPLGYYLVDSSVGALCGLTTTNPDASINAKNGTPSIDKQVQEDSTGNWGANNTADIGQIVEYRVTINVHAGAENYVLHDIMDDSLTFEVDNNKVPLYPKHTDPFMQKAYRGVWYIGHVIPTTSGGNTTTEVDAKYYKVTVNDKHSFDIAFTKEFCEHLEINDKIVIQYNAMLNRNAVIAGDGNVNTAVLDFGEGNRTNVDSVTTYTYGIDIVKTDSANKLINGAQFKIYDAATGGNEIAVVPLMDANDEHPVLDADDKPMYRRARADETGVNIVVTGGKITVVGFDNGTYYLEETKAPDGYNQLTGRQKFIISDGNLEAVFNGDIYSTGSGVHVVNKTGEMLPETGGMGTVMFITCGSVLVMAAGVLLVTKKRMNMIQD